VGASSADRVTKTLTGQIKQWLPEGAIATQWAEGVYVILLPQAHADSALTHAKRLSQQLREYYVDIDGSSLQFQFFVGASLFSETTTSPDAPILQALKACEIAKDQPNELAKLFEPDAKDQAVKVQRNDKDIERLLHKALENGRFKLLYQPILSLRGSTQEHYEVLVRMLDSKGDEITPDDFMETAQRIGLSAKIDRWIILDALKTLSKHRAPA
jgi:predicted signal transduction protein with EAL and GGDEF domain